MDEKIGKFDRKEDIDPYRKKGLETVGLCPMVMRFATVGDKFILTAAIIGMTIYGASRPMFSIMFG